MYANIIPYLLVGIPIAAELGYLIRSMRYTTILASILVLLASIYLYLNLPPAASAGLFRITGITFVFILMVASVYFLSALYSYGYLKDKKLGVTPDKFCVLINLFAASMLFSLVVNNYGLMWAGIEATTVASALLIMTEKSPTSTEATWRYLIIVSIGLVLAFLSILLIYYNFHTLSVSKILSIPNRSSKLAEIAVAIALVGIGTKVGLFPMGTWLPDAHSESPAPVSALFSGVLLPTALYVLYNIYLIVPITSLFTIFAIATIVIAAIALAYQKSYKRMFAYSSMENMGIALLGLSLGAYGVIGALMVLLAHSFGKAGAFYSSGNIHHSTGTREISEVSGLSDNMPITSSSLLLSSLAVTGTPPFGTFAGEFLIFYQMLLLHMYLETAIVMAALIAAFISINYNVGSMIFGASRPRKEAGGVMAYVPLVSALVSLAIGIAILLVFA